MPAQQQPQQKGQKVASASRTSKPNQRPTVTDTYQLSEDPNVRSRPQTVTINDILNQKPTTNAGSSLPANQQKHEKLELTKLNYAWVNYALSIKGNISLSKAMELSSHIELISDDEFTVTVTNEFQRNEIEDERGNIMRYLAQNLENDSLSMNLKVDETISRSHVKTKADRLADMCKKNSAVNMLITTLNLEIM